MLITFIMAFFLISPTVILYSAGYRYDFRNGLLRETGSLSVDVFPKNGTVYLDGLKLDGNMPVRLNNITPHKYSLKISAPGYYDWEKQIEVNKNQTTYIKEFYLLKKEKPVLLSKDKAENLSISQSNRYVAYSVKDKNQTRIMIFNTKTNTTSLATILDDTKPVKIMWSSNNDYFAVTPDTPTFKTIYVVNALTSKSRALTSPSGQQISKFIWGKNNEPELYFGDHNMIWSYLPRLQQTAFITTSTPYLDWYIDDGTLWATKYNTTTENLQIIEDTLGFKSIFGNISASNNETTTTLLGWRFETFEHGTVILRNANRDKFLIVRNNVSYQINASHYRYSKFNNWWLFWSKWELWSYSESDEPYLLNRSGAELNNVLPIDQFNTLGLTWNNHMTALYPYYYIEENLVERPLLSATVNPVARTLYFSDAGGFWKTTY